MKSLATLLLLVLAVGVSGSYAQSGNATLSGAIHDSSGAVIPAAKVVAKNVATGVLKETASNSAGLYVLPNLIPGSYLLDVSAQGFQHRQITDIKLSVDQQASIDVELMVGAITEQVEVSASPPLLQTEESSVGAVVQAQQVQNLPLNGRYFTQLLQLVPGASASVRTPGFGGTDPNTMGRERNGMPVFDVNGVNGGFTQFRVDGIENTEREFGGANIPVSVDAIQEFKLQTANFSAEYGRGAAQVDVVVKSGTNEIHGTLFEFLRNEVLDASQWAYTGPHGKRLLKRNQFGGSIGGPIKKDKLFWFFNYDGTREIYSAPRSVTVPTDDMRKGIFPAGEVISDWMAGRPFPNNTVPASRLDPTMQKVLPILPAPNLAGVAVTNNAGLPLPAQNNYFYNPRHRQTINQFNARIDYTLSPKDSLTGRLTRSSNFLVGDGPLATNIQGSIVGFENADLGGSNLSVGWFHNFSPSTINEVRFGFLTDPQNYAKGDTTDYPKQLGLDQYLYPGYFPGLPHFQIGSVNLGSGDYRPLQVGEKNFQWVDNATIVRGRHNIRVGGEARKTNLLTNNAEVSTGRFYFNGVETRVRANGTQATTPCVGASGSCANGDPMADFLLGYLSYYEAATPISNRHKYFSNWAAYVNDTWHVTPKLTATIGLRYEYQTRFHADPPAYAMPVIQNGVFAGKIAVPDPGGQLTSAIAPGALNLIPNSVVGCSTVGLPSETCLISDKKEWQPRLGFAYQLNRKTVIRAGGGIFFGYFFGDLDTEDGEQFPFIIRNQTATQTAPPSGSAPPPLTIAGNPKASAATPSPFIFASLPNRRVPATYQWNFTVERELDRNTMLSVGYVANVGRFVEGRSEYCCYYNMPQPWGVVLAPGQKQVMPDPRFSSNLLVWEDQDTSNYNSLQTRVERRLSGGLSFTAAYTWSKTLGIINWIADPRNPVQQPLDFDLRHNFVFSPIWQIPVGKGRHFLNAGGATNQVLGGWQITGIVTERSGFPFTPTLSGVNLLNMTKLVASLNLPDATCSGKISNPSALNWFDKSCFVTPAEPTAPGAPLRVGNLGINTLRGPSGFGLDFGANKQFPLTERLKLDFRFEAFNLVNHPVLGLPNTSIVPGNNTPANITYVMSLPRTLQFAMKLNF